MLVHTIADFRLLDDEITLRFLLKRRKQCAYASQDRVRRAPIDPEPTDPFEEAPA